MKKQEIYALVEKAYNANEFEKMFLGISPYTFNNLKHIPANVPTDINSIIEFGLYPIYKRGELNISSRIKKTIMSMLTSSPVAIWMGYSIIWSQYWNELEQSSPYKIIDNGLLAFCKKQVGEHSEELRTCNDFVGSTNKDGLLGDIFRLDANFKNRFGVSIL